MILGIRIFPPFLSSYHKVGVILPRLVLRKAEFLQYLNGLLCTLFLIYGIAPHHYGESHPPFLPRAEKVDLIDLYQLSDVLQYKDSRGEQADPLVTFIFTMILDS